MLAEKESKKISKFLSYVLRHHPALIGLELDKNGWAAIESLIEKSNAFGMQLDKEILQYIVATNLKKRFAFDETFAKIRASQGHSIEIELGYSAQKPPALLYHGTAVQFIDSILANGIQKQDRQHVHLSADVETAIQVGSRHGKPFVFTILSEAMHMDQFDFFLSENGVWLTAQVPVKYFRK